MASSELWFTYVINIALTEDPRKIQNDVPWDLRDLFEPSGHFSDIHTDTIFACGLETRFWL
ncbi:hypothetical protein HJC23_006419 [Cyclotella cryptica]|uniref:Uncharacterized protein n=1 Tax=Cyclotella cryptica TaxID=29204 RepID=A0ABD3QUX9_9STRA